MYLPDVFRSIGICISVKMVKKVLVKPTAGGSTTAAHDEVMIPHTGYINDNIGFANSPNHLCDILQTKDVESGGFEIEQDLQIPNSEDPITMSNCNEDIACSPDVVLVRHPDMHIVYGSKLHSD